MEQPVVSFMVNRWHMRLRDVYVRIHETADGVLKAISVATDAETLWFDEALMTSNGNGWKWTVTGHRRGPARINLFQRKRPRNKRERASA